MGYINRLCSDFFRRFEISLIFFLFLAIGQASGYRCVINKIRDFDLPLVGGQFSSIPRPLRERAEFQVELLRNLEIRLRGDLSLG